MSNLNQSTVFVSDDVVILSAKEYQELHTSKCINQGRADVKAGKSYTMDEFVNFTKEKIAEWQANQS